MTHFRFLMTVTARQATCAVSIGAISDAGLMLVFKLIVPFYHADKKSRSGNQGVCSLISSTSLISYEQLLNCQC